VFFKNKRTKQIGGLTQVGRFVVSAEKGSGGKSALFNLSAGVSAIANAEPVSERKGIPRKKPCQVAKLWISRIFPLNPCLRTVAFCRTFARPSPSSRNRLAWHLLRHAGCGSERETRAAPNCDVERDGKKACRVGE
jgi:hypothetical protein